jgi:hypothetical protein
MAEYILTFKFSGDSVPEMESLKEVLEGFDWVHDLEVVSTEERLERARRVTRAMLSGLMPGNTGINMADEVAAKVVAGIDA